VLAALPRQAANVRAHLAFGRAHLADSLGEIRRAQYGPAFQEAIERIAAEIPRDAAYRLVESRAPDCNPYWIRSALAPRAPRSLGAEAALRPEDLRARTAATPRVWVVGCVDGAPALLPPGAPAGDARP
jgi:hypothetical protein